jgi:hypothetical protein
MPDQADIGRRGGGGGVGVETVHGVLIYDYQTKRLSFLWRSPGIWSGLTEDSYLGGAQFKVYRGFARSFHVIAGRYIARL